MLDARGTVDVLRHGVVDLGVKIRLAFFEPAHGLTPELVVRYEANRLTVTRQLPYKPGMNKTLDLTLFVNGIPVATAELKNALTGQGVEDAKEQYRKDRDPMNVTLGRRAVVHFVVDTEQVAMTTRLSGVSTRLSGVSTRFLPFNRGYNGGKGNPPDPDGHRTAYLWERTWEKDAWLDLLGRFVHVEKPAKGSKAPAVLIFPRYHQWDAVLAPAIDRFGALAAEEQDGFRDALYRFVRTYSFLSQVVSFTDAGLERDYRFCRALASFVKRDTGASLDLGSEVELMHLQLEQTFEGPVSPEATQGVVVTIYDGAGRVREPEQSPLSHIIERLNERFGLKLTEADRLHLDSDYATLRKAGKDDRDLFGLHLNQVLITAVGMAAAANVGQEILEVGGKDLCRVHVKPSRLPVEATVVEVDKNGQRVKRKLFYGRFGNGTRAITDPTERERYKEQIWGA